MAKHKRRFRHAKFGRREIIDLVIFLLLIYILVPQFGKFRKSLALLKHLNWGWTDLGLACTAATVFVAAAIYMLLAKKRLRYWRTFSIQAASLFTNRLLPAGIGSLGINFEYLRRYKHSQAEAGAVVASSSLVGIGGHIILLAIILTATKTSLSSIFHKQTINWRDFLIAFGVLIIFSIVLIWIRKIRQNIFRTIVSTLKNIRGYRTHPTRLAGAVLFSMVLTLLYTLALLASARALGASTTLGQTLIVLTIGVIGGTITPTPGGLVGAEAGLFAGLLAYKIGSAEALAIVLLYRLITYWLAMAVGALALIWVEAAGYV